MKKYIIPILILIAAFGCVPRLGAQTFPINVKVSWDANPASDNVTAYILVFNGGAPINIDPMVACNTTVCTSQTFTVLAAGTYSASVQAVNQWAVSVPAPVQVNISAPGKSTNVKIIK